MASGFCAIPADHFFVLSLLYNAEESYNSAQKSPPGCMVLQTPEGCVMFYTPQETSLIRVKRIKVSASLLAHNQITASQFISKSCTPPDTSKSPPSTYCFGTPAEDFLASVNLFSGRNGFCLTPCRIVFLSCT